MQFDDPGLPAPAGLMGTILGLEDPEHIKFIETVADALGKISPSLLPQVLVHPLRERIMEGTRAFPELLALLAKESNPKDQAVILDAIGRIVDREHATQEVVAALRDVMAKTSDEAVTTLAAKALACSGDEAFLRHNLNFLASDDALVIRRAAMLLGFGRYAPAVQPLLLQLRPDNLTAADMIVWALGEIGSDEALPKLHDMLEQFELAEEVSDACGKIAALRSMEPLSLVAFEGVASQREHAAGALLAIVQRREDDLGTLSKDKLRAVFKAVMDRETSRLGKFYGMMGLITLDEPMDRAKMLRVLGAEMGKKEVDAMTAHFMNQAKRLAKKPGGPRPPRKKV